MVESIRQALKMKAMPLIVKKFLDFLAQEIEKNPHRVQPVTAEWADRLQILVKEVEIGDLNELLSGDDDLKKRSLP